MSGGSRDSYCKRASERSRSYYSGDAAARSRAQDQRRRDNEAARARIRRDPPRQHHRPQRDESEVLDQSAVKRRITRPAPGVTSVDVFIIDNTASNRQISMHIKASTGWLTSTLDTMTPKSQMAFLFWSDHEHTERDATMREDIDFAFPNKEGAKTIYSTAKSIRCPTYGNDHPEAFECALKAACEIDFGPDVVEKHLYLISDEVAHGMNSPMTDRGCPRRVNWRDSLASVHKTFDTFEVIGVAARRATAECQRQFIAEDRLKYDFIDLSHLSLKHRQGLVMNTLLFLVARHQGLQSVGFFLQLLHDKWLSDPDPSFGRDTASFAKKRILEFKKYLEGDEREIDKIFEAIFV